MDSDDPKNGFFMKHDMRHPSLILGAIYLLIAMVQIMVSFRIMDDPTGIIGKDPVSGFVLLIISFVFTGGALNTDERAEEARSYLLVGVLLGILYGLTGFLIAISKVLSELIGTGEGGSLSTGFLDPSVIMFYLLSISLLRLKPSHSHGRRRRKGQ